MPIIEMFRLSFRDGLHVGRQGIGQEETLVQVPADTLFAALVATRARLNGDVAKWVADYLDRAPFHITSAFPYAGGVYFYPRPVTPFPGIPPKTWKHIQFVSEGVLKNLLTGDLTGRIVPRPGGEEPLDGLTLQDGSAWLLRDEIPELPEAMRSVQKLGKSTALALKAVQRQGLWRESMIPRVTVDRLSNTSEIFHTGRINFQDGCGLWLGVQWQEPGCRKEVLGLLALLGESGLGAERSYGYGAFSFDEQNTRMARWPDPTPEDTLLLLSRFFPKKDEMDVLLRPDAAYEMVRIAGRAQAEGAADQRRRSVVLVTEGSLVGGNASGTIADVRPVGFPHNVLRYGIALGIGTGGGK